LLGFRHIVLPISEHAHNNVEKSVQNCLENNHPVTFNKLVFIFETHLVNNNDFFLVLVTAASSSDESSGRTFLHFKMLMEKSSGKSETLHLELTPKDFYKLLHEMERAKNNLEVLIGSSAQQQ